jgi:hypothetical protein
MDQASPAGEGFNFRLVRGPHVFAGVVEAAIAVHDASQAVYQYGQNRADTGQQKDRRNRLLNYMGDNRDISGGLHGNTS